MAIIFCLKGQTHLLKYIEIYLVRNRYDKKRLNNLVNRLIISPKIHFQLTYVSNCFMRNFDKVTPTLH